MTEAIAHTAFVTAPHAEQPNGWTIGWGDPGKAADVRPVRAAADHTITREAVAAYLAKYATKSTEATGHLSARITAETIGVYADDTHAGQLIDAAWTLGLDQDYRGLGRWAHTLGYGGHFFTKSRRYTSTFTAERQRRIAWRRTRAATVRLQRAGRQRAGPASRWSRPTRGKPGWSGRAAADQRPAVDQTPAGSGGAGAGLPCPWPGAGPAGQGSPRGTRPGPAVVAIQQQRTAQRWVGIPPPPSL